MIDRLIDFSLRNRFLVLGLTLLIVVAGLYTVRTNPVDAIPDLSETQVIVFADWPGSRRCAPRRRSASRWSTSSSRTVRTSTSAASGSSNGWT